LTLIFGETILALLTASDAITLPGAPLALVLSFLAAFLTLSRAPLRAQNAAREQTLFVSAVNDKGEPVDGLGADAFVVREDGIRREVLRASRAIEPIDIALLIDNSAAAEQEITFIRDGVSRFDAQMATNNHIALIALADRPTIFVDYSNDPKRLMDGVGRLFAMPSSGMTLLDGIIETSKGWSAAKHRAR
jgi:hypothetical protein